MTDIDSALDLDAVIGELHDDVRFEFHYIGVFEFRDGKITLWREFDDPMVSAAMVAGFAEGSPGASA
ncbi:hypothetical protein OK015_00400 [Mycobacterium sp. Aquia_216]|uniref:limonene-1,2-epoxide hydrolase family protein n=1 Tax=Mycobacterium sp. Aquia_216 TaxID=2991729 RepID=UPI00227B7BE2|nr:limonene-1,2-epoxide hydrolase family protein [Mycobacterium sp. Aquia_216]WAJ45037.1 hypothetical protein OK015_00400 [Mycobacterium sp. Aquia_216]